MYNRKFFIARLVCLMSLFFTTMHVADAQDKITGPWLWMIAPTEPGRGGSPSTDVDSLAMASGGAVTEAYIAANGANEGDTVGYFAWTLAEINDDGYDNVNEIANKMGRAAIKNNAANLDDVIDSIKWPIGDVNDYSSYALITLESAIDQRVSMLVGSDDSIKVWLNGKVVHNNAIDRGSSGFDDIFLVNLVAGNNLLMVKVSERSGGWSMSVGVDADVNAVYKPSTIFLSISPLPVVSPPVGEQFVVSIDIANGRDLTGYQLTLTFDITALRYVKSIQTTGYLPSKSLVVTPRITGNKVTLATISFDGVGQGNGTLAHVTFEVVAYKTSTLVLEAVKLVDSETNALPISVKNGKVVEAFGDVNGNGVVNIQDLVLVANSFGKTGKTKADVNGDGIVDITDLVIVAGSLQTGAAGPFLHVQSLETLSATNLRQWLSQAYQLNISDVRYQRGILTLEHLLAVSIPQETVLLPNYPNPFNPETWIPYQLAAFADATVQIYTASGMLVRTLTLGHQPAGIYQHRSRAAYWDGKNAVGESVASGVYFYTLTAGDFTATRKMLIRK